MYKRHEPFRYQFDSPIEGSLSVIHTEDGSERSNKGAILVYNLSPKGCCFTSDLILPIKQELKFFIQISLNGDCLDMPGYTVWKKPTGKTYMYGFSLDENNVSADQITNAIKRYVGSIKSN
ncbi:PilZ domain-containing protein [Bacillus testis]|uniref:PilZ domain-containing protein n=1 Tax=Bacillus testis TaxID=1622072 RepID=UPI00067EA713|nr:PilZ domain-containing protein [Bacillus testis]